MATSHVFVVDSALRRTQIKVTPGTYMREVLEEACKTKKLDPEAYSLKTQNNKLVDLAQPFRLSGLTAGAKLQLTQASRSPSVVTVALQLPESEGNTRLSDKFPSNTSLWLILRKYEDAVAGQSKKKLNLTQRSVSTGLKWSKGPQEYEQPVLNLMGRNMDNFVDLQKTLAQLGINNGNVLIRVTFKKSGQPLAAALKEIQDYFRDVEATKAIPQPVASASSAAATRTETAAEPTQEPGAGTSLVEPPSTLPVDASEPQTTPADQPTADAQEEPSNVVEGMSVYRPPTSGTPAAALQEDDPTTFEPSIDHAKAHQAALQRATRNQRLPSDKEIAEAESAKQAQVNAITSVTIRIRYPDQSIIETPSLPASTTSAADLYDRVKGTLAHASEPFELKFTGAKGHETLPNTPTKLLVRDLGFRGKVLVTLIWTAAASPAARQGPSLKTEFLSKAQDLKVELAKTARDADDGKDKEKKSVADAAAAIGNAAGKAKGSVEAKMKKFLNFGRK